MPKFVKQQTFHGGFHLVGYYRGSSNVALGNPFQTRDFPQVVVAPPPGEGKSTTVLWGIAAHGFDWAEGPTGPVQVYARVKNVAQCRSLVDYARSSPLAKNITANAQIAYDHIPEGQGSLLHPVAVACTYTTKGSLMRPVVAAARKWAKSQAPIVLALDKAQGMLAGANRLKALLVLVRKLRAQGTLITVLLIRATIERAWALRIGEIFVDVFSSVKIKSCHLLYTSILSMFLPTLVFLLRTSLQIGA
jgi:hypothetical protein